jgi:DNA polymerase-3 subunit gamma/tau
LEAFQNEDLPSVLNLYDEIDKKGFEGDMFLNNFSEFFRNLLVAKDTRSINMINTVEEFKQRYADKASTISKSYLIGGMNILNDAEIGFKQARSKRLHVEFHLIRLTHLAQAVTLLNEGTLQKKKQLDDLKTVAFKNIQFTEIKTVPGKKTNNENHIADSIDDKKDAAQQKASLKIEEELYQSKPEVPQKNIQEAETAPIGLGALKKIREQIQHKKQEKSTVHPLSIEKLNSHWNDYLGLLLEKNQVTSHSNLSHAKLKVTDNDHVEIIANSRIQYQFIENERINLLSYIHEKFNNPKLQIQIILEQTEEDLDQAAEVTLSQKDQYLKMISLYPMVKELKDKLNLDLDY